MKGFLLFFCFSIVVIHYSFAQNPGEWMWIHGTNVPYGSASYGTQGVASPTNVPASSYESCDWADLNGNFWLFGGTGNSSYLWKYDPITNEWTWMTGNGTTNFGVQGVSSPTNNPPTKWYGAASWVDVQGNLWVFGGLSTSSDLWKYNPSVNEWVWMKGAQSGGNAVYGLQGVPDTANTPGPRSECVAAWTDSSNNLWLFGGYGNYNDLWRYTIATNTWTWMKGSNTTGQAGVYGTLGVEAPANTPGARAIYTHWKDKNENLWLFGGTNAITTSAIAFNDLWRYNPVTNNWAWMGGLTTTGAVGDISVGKCISDTANWPGQKYENSASWTDQCGNFWMCGGTTDGNFVKVWNDLWMYSPVSNQWTWVSGDTASNPVPNWGTKNVSSPTNKMNGRGGNLGWYDNQGHIYLFGGYSSSPLATYNDLWKFTIDTNCVNLSCSIASLPVAVFTSSDTAFCTETGECINFFDHSTGNPTSWQWSFPGASPSSSTLQNPDSICYTNPGSYAVQLIVSNGTNYDTLTVSPLIIFGSAPAPPTITLIGGDTLVSSHGATYQWYYNGAPIVGATDSFYVEQQNGTYAVQITDVTGGCNSISNGFTITGIGELNTNDDIYIYPNPASHSVTINWPLPLKRDINIELLNVLGERVYIAQHQTLNSRHQTILDISGLSNGVYFLKIELEDRTLNKKFVVVH